MIVVDSPDTELFEQAIFIVRNDILSERGVTAQMLVDEACRVAKSCSRASPAGRRWPLRRLWPLFYGALGALGIGLAWLLTALAGAGLPVIFAAAPPRQTPGTADADGLGGS